MRLKRRDAHVQVSPRRSSKDDEELFADSSHVRGDAGYVVWKRIRMFVTDPWHRWKEGFSFSLSGRRWVQQPSFVSVFHLQGKEEKFPLRERIRGNILLPREQQTRNFSSSKLPIFFPTKFFLLFSNGTISSIFDSLTSWAKFVLPAPKRHRQLKMRITSFKKWIIRFVIRLWFGIIFYKTQARKHEKNDGEATGWKVKFDREENSKLTKNCLHKKKRSSPILSPFDWNS